MENTANKVIEVLQYLGEQLGVVWDWSKEEILPQIINIMGKYRTAQIIRISIILLAYLAFIFLFFRVIKGIGKAIHNKTPHILLNDRLESRDVNTNGLIIFTFGIIILIPLLVHTPAKVDALISWIFIPEIEFAKLVATLSEAGLGAL